jgi:hypothetical protein
MKTRATTVVDASGVDALNHPIRRAVLKALREPNSAAAVARDIGLPVRPAGERRKGHLIEKLYEAVAGTFVISPRLAWDDEQRTSAIRDQISLRHLVLLGEELQQDANGLIDRAAFDGDDIPSASVAAEVRFTTEEDRGAFMEEYLALLGPLLDRYGSTDGKRFKVLLAAYPNPEED